MTCGDTSHRCLRLPVSSSIRGSVSCRVWPWLASTFQLQEFSSTDYERKKSPTLEGNMWHNRDFPITIDCNSRDAQDLHTAGRAFLYIHLFLYNFRSCFHTTFDHVRHCVTHITFQRNRLMMYGFQSMPCYVHT
jgi:hypothetical protein